MRLNKREGCDASTGEVYYSGQGSIKNTKEAKKGLEKAEAISKRRRKRFGARGGGKGGARSLDQK